MNHLSLRLRIFLSYLLLIVPMGLILILFSRQTLDETIEGSFFSNFEEDRNFVEDQVGEWVVRLVADDSFDEQDLFNQLSNLAEDIDLHLVLLDLAGENILFNSMPDRRMADLPSQDVEFLLEVGFPDEVETDDEFVYAAHYVYDEEEPAFILRIGRSMEEVGQTQQTRATALTLTTIVVGAGVLLLLGSWMANTLTQPLKRLRTTAQAMARGDLSTRAEMNGPQEVAALANDFNEMAAAVETMVTEQKAFSGNVAHELRTPLTAIRLRTESLLEDDPDATMTRQYIKEIDSEARRLSGLVDDLRLLARADAQRVAVGREMVDFGRIIRTLHQEYQSELSEKQLTWLCQIDPELPTVEAGLNHMQVVMRNLIDNAIKYTPDGGEIEVLATADADQVIVTVRDSGVGISAEDLPNLFTRFYRADKSRNRTIPGSGLGLGIVESLLDLYGGSIVIESEGIGHGTKATLMLAVSQG